MTKTKLNFAVKINTGPDSTESGSAASSVWPHFVMANIQRAADETGGTITLDADAPSALLIDRPGVKACK